MNFEDILAHFHNVSRNGGQCRANCPACGDTKQHLYIKQEDGKILFDCKKGCAFTDIIRAVGLTEPDCFPEKEVKGRWTLLREHIYTDEKGANIAKKQIYDKGDGKTAVWYRLERGQYIKGLNGTKLPLYHLHKLVSSASDTVVIVEGEKDVETAEKMGFTATTSPNGAGAKWRDEYCPFFTGKNVCIVMDNDEAGEGYGYGAAAKIRKYANAVKLIRSADIYPSLKPKGDISDIAAEIGIEETKRLLTEAVGRTNSYVPPAPQTAEKVNRELENAAPVNELIAERLAKLRPHERFSCNDKGNGQLFAEVFKDVCRYNVTAKEWYVYRDGYWQADTGGMIAMRYAKELHTALVHYGSNITDESRQKVYLENVAKLAQRRYRETMLKDAQDGYFVKSEDFDRNEWLFNCINGTYDLRQGFFRKHNPKDLISKISNVVYDENARSDTFGKFIGTVMCGSTAKIRYLQKAFGYSLTGDTSQECFFILYGATSRNGKGTLMETMSYMMGNERGYAMAAAPETFAGKQNKDSRQASGDIARLKGVRFLNSSEPSKKMVFDAALLKTLTGRDTITARHLHEREFQFVPSFKLFINTNYLPHVNDDTLFASDRVNVITFDRHFGDDERDPELKEKLKSQENISGLFNWCLEGLRLYKAEGLKRPEEIAAATAEYQNSSDRQAMFINECLISSEGSVCKSSDVFNIYRSWCQANGYYPENKSNFMAGFRNKNLLHDTGRINGNTYHNVILGYTIDPDYYADPNSESEQQWEDIPL